MEFSEKVSLEIEGEDGSRIIVGNGSKECGRGLGFLSDDRTVSRRHVSFELLNSSRIGKNHKDINPDSEPMVSFEVLGKNPIWVYSSSSGDVKAFGRFERGELRVGDRFCVSAKKPILFRLKRIVVEDPEGKEQCVPKAVECSRRVSEAKEMAERIQNVDGKFEGDGSLGFESLNVSDIDPVKEFGFVVMGHEFDCYPKQMVRDINNWKWYLEEPREDIEDDEPLEGNSSKGKKIVGRKKNDDEEWTGESEDEKVLMEKIRRAKRPRHSMARSKDHGEYSKDMGSSKCWVQRKTVCSDQGEDEEDKDEDNLGGFIVNDDDLELEEHEEEEEEEEEDYDDDDDDDNEGNDD